MKLGFGLYRHMLDRDHLRFARQNGATHVIVHYVDYFHQGSGENPRGDQPTGGRRGWGYTSKGKGYWTVEELTELRRLVESEHLVLHAIENLDPAHWHDVLLDGPEKAAQLEAIRQTVRNLAAAGISTLGYNFSLAGVYGRAKLRHARGEAEGLGLAGAMDHEPMPAGMVWNMIYDARRADDPAAVVETRALCSSEELWRRLGDFLDAVVPVAEEVGVTLAAHPDDPPLPQVRGTPRLVYQPHLYQRLLDRRPSPANQLEFCLGTIAEMSEGNACDAVETYSAQRRISYIHCRNVRGRVPHYHETFIDEGDIDILRVLRILKRNRFDGVLIPDHTPLMSCPAPWHAGMAFAMGYLRAALQVVSREA